MAFQNLTKNERDAVTLFSRRVKDLLRKNLVSVKLFGSKIRGDFSAHSDIDILLVVKEKSYSLREQIYDILLQIDLEYDPKISLKIFSVDEMEKNKQLESPFFENIEREGIQL